MSPAPWRREPRPRRPLRRRRAPRRRRRTAIRRPRAKHPVTALDMHPVPVIVASIGSPFAIAADRSPSETWSTGPVTDATTPSVRAASRASAATSATAADRLDSPHLGRDADKRGDLTRVTAEHCDVDLAENPARGLGAVRRGAGPDRVEHDRDAARVRGAPGSEHRLDPVRRERADVQDERAGEPDHLLDLLRRVRHHGQRPERERRVRRLVHHHVVRDLVDERLALPHAAPTTPGAHAAPFRLRMSTGPSPAPSSGEAVRDGGGGGGGGAARGVLERLPAGKERGEGRRVGAAGAVSCARRVARRPGSRRAACRRRGGRRDARRGRR